MHPRIAIILALLFGLAGTCRPGEQPAGRELQLYDVRFLAATICDYPGPEMGVPRSMPSGGHTGPVHPQAQVAPTLTSVADMIKARVDPDHWDETALGTTIREDFGFLGVQTPKVHKDIEEFLKVYGAGLKQQVLVKGLLLETSELPQATSFDAAALAKLLGPQGLASARANFRVRCFNTARTHVFGGTQANFIKDYTISGDLYEPVVDTDLSGCAFDVRPILAQDHKSAEIELRFNCAEEGGKETHEITMDSGAKPPAGAPGLSGRLPVDLPAQKMHSIQSQVHVPAGKWVLAGSSCERNADGQNRYSLLLLAIEPITESGPAVPPARAPVEFARPPLDAVPAAGALTLKIYDVRDICYRPSDFLIPSDTAIEQNRNFGYIEPTEQNHVSQIADALKTRWLPAEFADPATAVEEQNGMLVVTQMPAVHARIQALLQWFREELVTQLAVRGVVLATSEVPEASSFDDAAFNQLKNKCITVYDSMINCRNVQGVGMGSGKNTRYVQTYTISGSLYDPLTETMLDGTAFNVRPILSPDRSLVQLDVGFRQTLNVKLNPRRLNAITALPGADMSSNTTTINPAGNIQLDIDLPTAEVATVQTQLAVAPGKWALAGMLPNPDPKAAEKNLLILVRADVMDQQAPAGGR